MNKPGKRAAAARRECVNQAISEVVRGQGKYRDDFLYFLSIVQSRSTLLQFSSWKKLVDVYSLNHWLLCLLDLAKRNRLSVRPLSDWWPDELASPLAQYRSLLKHLFAKYDVPGFLLNATSRSELRALIKIGRGRSVRDAFPIAAKKASQRETSKKRSNSNRLSKKQSQILWDVPHHYTGNKALTWVFAVSKGASPTLVNQLLVNSRFDLTAGDKLSNEMIRFFVRCEAESQSPSKAPCLAFDEVPKIWRFYERIKYRPAHDLLGYQAESDEPLMPELSLEKRGLRWMRRLMANWKHVVELPAPRNKKNHHHFIWKRCEIAEFKWNDGENEWTIEELCSSHALIREGLAMRHCVAIYDQSCFESSTSIWSVRRHHKSEPESNFRRMATLEVWGMFKSIEEVRAKYNDKPTEKVMRVVEQWARQQKLSFDLKD